MPSRYRTALRRTLQLFAIVFVGACQEDCDQATNPSESYEVRVNGQVTVDGEPVPGVNVAVGSSTEATDEEGRYDVILQSSVDYFVPCIHLPDEPFATATLYAVVIPCPTLSDGDLETQDFAFVQEVMALDIDEPEDEAVITDGSSVRLTASGTADVYVNGNRAAVALEVAWTSSLDGDLGTAQVGGSSTVSLSEGTHTLSAELANVLGASTTREISVTVGEAAENEAPVATITAPEAGLAYPGDQPIDFAGTGEDPEDGTLTGASLVWTSSIEGEIGTGESFSRTMAPGSHFIELTVTDAQGATDAEMIAIHINAATGTITGTVSFGGDPLDDVTVDLTGAATATTGTNAQGTYSFTDLAPGSYTVTISPPPGLDMATEEDVELSEGETATVNFEG